MRRLVIAVAGMLGLGLLGLGAVLGHAHYAIRQIRPALPSTGDIARAFEAEADLPVRLSLINTASQKMPRAAVLERSSDPHPDEPYVMALPAFVLEWADGRAFIVDLGMDAKEARPFGRPSEILAGADPVEPRTDVAAELRSTGGLARVAGVGLTHLHADHTQGAIALCKARAAGGMGGPIPLFQTDLQAREGNYTTTPGRDKLDEAGCLQSRPISARSDGGLLSVPGFPGLGLIATGGHTPGSQVFVARVQGPEGPRTWVLVGDLVNHVEGVRGNVPKPRLYSVLAVPEDTRRLEHLRRYLRELDALAGVDLLVSHDQNQLQASGIQPYR